MAVQVQRDLFLEMIENEAERLRGIASQLLAAGSLDAGSLSPALAPVDVDPLLRDVVAAAEFGKPERITFTYRATRKQVTALGDAELLRQVLASILDNAVKYSPEGGTITVSIRTHEDVLRLAVADQGLGIPPSESERIFTSRVMANVAGSAK